MVKEVEYGSSDKTNWFKNHVMTEEQKKKLIEDKLQRLFNRPELEKKVDKLLQS